MPENQGRIQRTRRIEASVSAAWPVGDVLLHQYEVNEEVSAPCHLQDQEEQAKVSACQAIESELCALCNLCVTDLAGGQ